MTRIRIGLWAYLAFIVGVIVAAALVAYGAYNAQERFKEAQADVLGDARDLAQTVAASTAHFLITGAYDGVEQTLLRLAGLQQVKSIELFDVSGGAVSAVVVQAGTPRASFTRRTFRVPDGAQQLVGDDQFTMVVPIERGSTIGWVRTETDAAHLRTIRARIWRETILVLLVTLTMIMGGLAWGLRRAVRPLTRSTEFAESLTRQRGQPLELASPVREVSSLAQALNRLSVTLREQETALRASELRKSAILEASLDCLITIDERGRVVEFNPTAERTFGYAREEAVGRTMSELIVPPAMRAAHEAGMKRYLDTGHGPVLRRRIELAAVDRDGREFPVEVAIVPFDVDGKPYFAGYLRDITAQKTLEQERATAEAALRLQSERMRVGQLAAGLLIMDWDIPRDELSWSDSPEWLRGPVPAETGAYPPFLQQVHPEDREAFVAMRRRALDHLSSESFEYRVVRTDGEVRWVDSRHLVFSGPDGKAARMIIALHDITERKQALEAARSAQEKLARLLSSSRIIVYIDRASHAFECTYMSDNAKTVVGFDAAEFVADPALWASRVHPDDLPGVHRDFDRLLESGHFEHEYRFRHADGRYRWMRDEQTLRRNADGEPTEVVGAWWDITDRRHAEARLADSERRYRMLADNASDLVQVFDADNRRLYVSPSLIRLMGPHFDAASPFGTYVHADDRSRIKRVVDALRGTGGEARAEFRYMLPDRGEPIWVEAVAKRLEDGEIRGGVLITMREVTERKQIADLLEQSVRALQGQKHALDEHAIVSITDREGRITYANERFVAVSGYPREALMGQTHRLIKSGLHAPAFYAEMWETITAGRAWHGEIANRSRDGVIYWVASTIVPLLDAHGRPQEYIAIRTDITRQKNVELALSEARDRELETGHAIQDSLLLGEVPRLRTLEIATFAQPSQGVDGDFYDFFAVHGRSCDVLIGDVMGKGVTAALMGAGLKNQYGRVLSQLLAPGRASTELPRPGDIINQLHRRITGELIRLDAFVTLAYCRIDLHLGRLLYIGAGHPPAIHVTADGATSLVAGGNLPLGIDLNERYVESTHPFDVGDLLFLYSDGVTEARDAAGEEYGQARLAAHVRSLRAAGVPPAILVQSVRRAVAQFTSAPAWTDDFTIIAFQNRGEQPDLHSEEFVRDLAELTRLRNWVGDLSAAFLAEDATQRMILAAVEVASNIVRHADVPVRSAAFLCHHDITPAQVRLDFFYMGKPYDRTAVAPPDFSGAREGGFGLFIIEHSVDAFSQSVLAEDVNRLSLVMNRKPRGARP